MSTRYILCGLRTQGKDEFSTSIVAQVANYVMYEDVNECFVMTHDGLSFMSLVSAVCSASIHYLSARKAPHDFDTETDAGNKSTNLLISIPQTQYAFYLLWYIIAPSLLAHVAVGPVRKSILSL